MTYAEKIRQKIDAFMKKEKPLWDRVTSNSRDYMEALQLTEADFKILECLKRRFGFLQNIFLRVDVGGEQFAFVVKEVCAPSYGVTNWKHQLMVICTSNNSFNQKIGVGTTYISVVSDKWHQKIIKHLKEKK